MPPSRRTGLRIIYVNSYDLLFVTRGPWKLEHSTSKRGPGERIPAAKCCWATQRLPVSWEKPLTHANHAAYPQPDAHSSQTSPASVVGAGLSQSACQQRQGVVFVSSTRLTGKPTGSTHAQDLVLVSLNIINSFVSWGILSLLGNRKSAPNIHCVRHVSFVAGTL